MSLLRLLASASLGLPFAVPAVAQDPPAPACFAAAHVDPILGALPRVGSQSDELARLAADDDTIPRMSVYFLSRQTTLVERIQRRLEQHSEFTCVSSLEGVSRDFAMLTRTFAAFAHGDKEIAIARVESARMQEILVDVVAQLKALEPLVSAVKWEPPVE